MPDPIMSEIEMSEIEEPPARGLAMLTALPTVLVNGIAWIMVPVVFATAGSARTVRRPKTGRHRAHGPETTGHTNATQTRP